MSETKLNVLPEEQQQQQPWYKEGLRFSCVECGQCCTGAPGYVWVTLPEIEAMAAHLNISVDIFARRYLRKVGDRYSLAEDAKTYDCVFLKDKRCSIYAARPKQCRTYPWWMQNLKTKKDWEEAAKCCPGINEEAPLIPFEEIEASL